MPLETPPQQPTIEWQLARRTRSMSPSVVREILKVTEQVGVISFAGGLPAPSTFPVDEIRTACDRILKREGQAALQYGPSEGFWPLRAFIAQSLPWSVDPATVLITTGSQQGFDLIGKVLFDPGARLLVESPTYLGALQAFAALDADVVAVTSGPDGIDLLDLQQKQVGARALYIQPNFQNPTGRTMPFEARHQLGAHLQRVGLPFIEDNPYGPLWFDSPPPPPLTAIFPQNGFYLGTLSKILAPGLRLGYLVVPQALFSKILHVKQAADLHTSTLDQRVAHEVIQDGFLEEHTPKIRNQYRLRRDLMLSEMQTHLTDLGVQWNIPSGGMFIWARLPSGMNAEHLLTKCLSQGVAFVPGTAFYAGVADARSFRLSFVNAEPEQIRTGMEKLAHAIAESLEAIHAK